MGLIFDFVIVCVAGLIILWLVRESFKSLGQILIVVAKIIRYIIDIFPRSTKEIKESFTETVAIQKTKGISIITKIAIGVFIGFFGLLAIFLIYASLTPTP